MKNRSIRGLALGAALVAATPAQAAIKGKAGYYTQTYYVLSASVSGAGSCIDTVGTYFTEQFYYPGPAKNGATAWRAFTASGLLENEQIVLPQTPAAGATNWSGTYTATFLPGGTPFKASFTTQFTVTDATSVVGTTTIVAPTQQGGTCTETVQFNQLYTGK